MVTQASSLQPALGAKSRCRQDQAVSKIGSERSTASYGARNVNEGAH